MSFDSSVFPHLGHFSPAFEGDSTCKQSGHTATWKITSPSSGAYSLVPRNILIKTDLPEPLRPKIPSVSPSSISTLIFLRT